MSRYLVSPAAQAGPGRDLGIHPSPLGRGQAEDYIRELQRAIGRAVANPPIGRAGDEIRIGYRKLVAGSHVLFYRVTDNGVIDVVRVRHQRTDVDRHV